MQFQKKDISMPVISLIYIALFAILCSLITREMHMYSAYDRSGWTDWATTARLVIVTILTMGWVHALMQEHHTSVAGFLVIGAFIIALLNTSIVIIGELLKLFKKKAPLIIPTLTIIITATLGLSIASIVLFGSIATAAPIVYQSFIAIGSTWFILLLVSSLIIISKKG